MTAKKAVKSTAKAPSKAAKPLEEIMPDCYEIRVNVTRWRRKDGSGIFYAYDGYDKNGKKVKFKFRNECKDKAPQSEGEFILYVPKGYLAKDNSTMYNDWWIRKLHHYEAVEEELEPVEDSEDIPF